MSFVEDAAPGDMLSSANTIATHASIIIRGTVSADDPQSSVKTPRADKVAVGAGDCVDWDCLLLQHVTMSERTLFVLSFCELLIIDKNDFNDIRHAHPNLDAHLETFARTQKGRELTRSIKKRSEYAKKSNFDRWGRGGKTVCRFNQRGMGGGDNMDEEVDDGGAVVSAMG